MVAPADAQSETIKGQKVMTSLLIHFIIIIASLLFMEVFAIIFHKYWMHGPGWSWHKSHHNPPPGYFEKNDLYALCFSVIAAGLFITGSLYWPPLWSIGLGFTLYGLLYAFVHDGLVHQRWPIKYSPKNRYLRRLIHAHRLHHHITQKDGAVSFGFLWAPPVDKLKAQLKQAD